MMMKRARQKIMGRVRGRRKSETYHSYDVCCHSVTTDSEELPNTTNESNEKDHNIMSIAPQLDNRETTVTIVVFDKSRARNKHIRTVFLETGRVSVYCKNTTGKTSFCFCWSVRWRYASGILS